jgi:hypothetical protein
MPIYVPNIGERKWLRTFLQNNALILGLFKNQVVPDGNTLVDTLEELPEGGYLGYLPKALANDIVENAEAASKWFLYMNAQGKAEAQYGLAASPLEWTFNAYDVAAINTVYGVFGFVWVVPFDAGQSEGPILVGDTIEGGSSGATGIVTEVVVTSGTWDGDNAAGYLTIKSKSGEFDDNEALQVNAVTLATSNTATANAGDAHKHLVFVDAFSEGHLIDTVGMKIQYTPKLNLSTA